MPQIWQARIKGQDGALVKTLTGQRDGFTGFSFQRTCNSPGTFILYFMKRADESFDEFQAKGDWFEIDGQVEFWRRWLEEGISWQLEGEYLILDKEVYTTVDGGTLMYVYGRGYLDLVGRRIVEAPTNSAGAVKTGATETVIKEYVTEQCLAAGRELTGFTVQADLGQGEVHGPHRHQYRNVLEAIQEAVGIGGGDIDVVGTGAATFEMRWYEGQRGTDRSGQVIFSVERGNMAQPRLAVRHREEVTAVLVGGQGQEDARELVWRTDPTRIATTPWNRREAFRDARQESETTGLETLGDQALEAGKPQIELTFVPIQGGNTLYGRDYFFGDLVTCQHMGFSDIRKIHQVVVTWNNEQQEISVEMKNV